AGAARLSTLTMVLMDEMRLRGSFLLVLAAFVLHAQKGKEEFEKVCAKCHPAEQASSKRHSKAGWEHTIDDMVTKGAEATDEQFDAIIAYLAANYGPVNVNQATAKELEESKVFSATESESIVQFRRDHGKIENLDALKRVPGIDQNKVEKKADGIAF
ncbi:MAG TPA: helix-hairpin-helix domain-containing protein, partial [Bryobacteraceae bacterium]|nr:helix-hairpin-helix domain-containing protein [Bryobacteraceae bacterium]